MLIIYFLITISLLLIGLWIVAFWVSNDFTIPLKRQFPYKRILVIYPHPDDEVLTTGGLFQKLTSHGVLTNLLVLSQGEKGTPDASIDTSLGKTRANEMTQVANLLNIQNVVIDRFPDGELSEHKEEIQSRITEMIDDINPELVITYDFSGMYGHEDHIVLSKIVTTLIKEHYPDTSLWYASLPSKVYDRLDLPIHMAKSNSFLSQRKNPTHRVWIGRHIFNKVRAVYAHKSQYLSFRNSIPVKILPIWFFLSTGLFEYFHEVITSNESED